MARALTDYVTTNRGYVVRMAFFDSHYYFPEDFSVENDWNVDLVATTGGNFFEQTGKYFLPLGDGVYHVTPTAGGFAPAHLMMNTRGGSNVYSHPLVNYDDAAATFDAGWYTWFYDVTPPEKWQEKRRLVHVFSQNMDPQRTFLGKEYEKLAAVATKKTG